MILPRDMLVKIAGYMDDNTLFAFAMSHPVLREVQEEVRPNDPEQDKKVIKLRKLGYLGHDARFTVSGAWIKWAHEEMGQESYERHGDRRYLILLASLNGHLKEVKWLKKEGWSLTEKDTRLPCRTVCEYAAQGGHLKVLQWLRAQGCPWDWVTCSSAALGGHLKVLQWAREQGCPWNLLTCAYAARGGHLKVLQWARAQGCPWDKDTCVFAALGGHLKVLQWAREQGCPWDEETCFDAA